MMNAKASKFEIEAPDKRVLKIAGKRTTFHQKGDFLNDPFGHPATCFFVAIVGKLELRNCMTGEKQYPINAVEALTMQFGLMQKDITGQSVWVGDVLVAEDAQIVRITIQNLGEMLINAIRERNVLATMLRNLGVTNAEVQQALSASATDKNAESVTNAMTEVLEEQTGVTSCRTTRLGVGDTRPPIGNK